MAAPSDKIAAMNRTDGILVGVAGVIWNEAGQVLLIRRRNPPRAGQWSLPGGKLERGESLHQALRREIREETGLEVEILGLAGVAEIADDRALGGSGRQYVLIDYGTRVRAGTARAASDAAEAAWFGPDDLAQLPLWDETRRIIAESAKRHMGIEI
jgi:8-oxo-dGTP diphosphatase